MSCVCVILPLHLTGEDSSWPEAGQYLPNFWQEIREDRGLWSLYDPFRKKPLLWHLKLYIISKSICITTIHIRSHKLLFCRIGCPRRTQNLVVKQKISFISRQVTRWASSFRPRWPTLRRMWAQFCTWRPKWSRKWAAPRPSPGRRLLSTTRGRTCTVWALSLPKCSSQRSKPGRSGLTSSSRCVLSRFSCLLLSKMIPHWTTK